MATKISNWSATPASNNASPPNGAPEGMAPSAVNNVIREIMTAVRNWFIDPMWTDFGYTYVYVAATQFKVAGSDVTADFPVGKRVRAIGSSTGTIYGSITVSAFSTDTTITVSWDSGTLSNETLAISVGLPGLGSPIAADSVKLSSLTTDATPDATADFLLSIDTSASSASKKITFASLFTSFAGFTAETSVDTASDLLLLLDAGDSNAPKKVTPTALGGVLGKQSIWIPAVAMIPRTTSGAAYGSAESTTNKIMIKTLDFDKDTAEYAQFAIRMPKSWNEGTITAEFVWSGASGTGNTIWGIQGVAEGDGDTIDAAFGTGVTVTDGVGTAGTIRKTEETSAVTISGTPAAGDLCIFQVYRDAANGSDTFSVDARLHGVMIFFTVDTGNDA